MIRFFALLALTAFLAACDTAGPESAVSGVTAGATYSASGIALHDAETDAVVYDFLADGAVLDLAFRDGGRFEARYVISEASIRASGETDDVDGGIDATITGTYDLADDRLTFTLDEPGERYVFEGTWSVEDGEATLRRRYAGPDQYFEVVLTQV